VTFEYEILHRETGEYNELFPIPIHLKAHLAQDRGQWRALLNMVMNLRVSYNVGKFLSS
jgi:hypothetical protein